MTKSIEYITKNNIAWYIEFNTDSWEILPRISIYDKWSFVAGWLCFRCGRI